MARVISETAPATTGDSLSAELEAYNRAFCELELPWRWDAETFRQLLSMGSDQDCIGAYVERSLSGHDLGKRLSILQQVIAKAPEGRYASLASVARGGLIDRGAERELASRYMGQLRIKAGSVQSSAATLSVPKAFTAAGSANTMP